MNNEPVRDHSICATIVGVLGAIAIVAILAWAIHRYTQPAPLGEDRAAYRAQTFTAMRAAETEALNNTAWIDQSKGLVRLRIQDAMQIVERDWAKNPVAARSNLIERVEKATAPPPKAPEKPSQFE